MPIFCQKRQLFQKHRALMSFFSNFSWKTPCCHAHIRSKKRQVWQKYKILWTSKVNRMPYFFQKRPLSKKTLLSFAYFVKKTSILSKIRCSLVICFIFFLNPLLTCPNLVKKTSNLSKLQCLWANKVNIMPFFPIFYEKTLLSCPYFLKKNVNFPKNTLLSCPYFIN